MITKAHSGATVAITARLRTTCFRQVAATFVSDMA